MRIFDFAVVADWESRLEDLAEMAEPERWTYLEAPARTSLPVLDSYLRYTFLRLTDQGRIAETDDLACFNTGLLTPGQEEIYGVFTVSDHFDPGVSVGQDNKKWFLKTWARAGDGILTSFRSLPALATYWDDPGQLILNPALEIQPNLDHIVRENLPRFPVELGGTLDEKGVPGELLDTEDDVEEEEIRDEPQVTQEDGGEQSGSPEVPLIARNALEGAMTHAVRLARRSYRIAVPQFHRGKIQLLLPLYLRDARRPTLALTLQRHGDWYRAATVLYPDWAYRHARLLSRPNSEWLGGFREDVTP